MSARADPGALSLARAGRQPVVDDHDASTAPAVRTLTDLGIAKAAVETEIDRLLPAATLGFDV